MITRLLQLIPRKATPSFHAWIATRDGVTVRCAPTRAELRYQLERAIHRPNVLWTCGVELDPAQGTVHTVHRRARQSLTVTPVEWADCREVLAQLAGMRVTLVTHGRRGRTQRELTLMDVATLYNSLSDNGIYHAVILPRDAPSVAVCLFRLAHTQTLVGAVVDRAELREYVTGQTS